LRVNVPVPPGSVHAGGWAAARSAVSFVLAKVRLALAAARYALAAVRLVVLD